MEWFRQLGRAIRNLARLSRQNPVWVIRPLRLIRHLFRVLVLLLAMALVLIGGCQFVLHSVLGLPRNSDMYQLAMILAVFVVIFVVLRDLFQPLIARFGAPDTDGTHGSVHLIEKGKTTLPTQRENLPFSRDSKTAKPLSHDTDAEDGDAP